MGSLAIAGGPGGRLRAHSRRSRRETPPPPAAKTRVKLAVLPVDADAFPQIAASLNNALHDVKVKGVDDYFLSKVTLEVVQLSIECVQATSECYGAAGKSLSANKLLLGHIVALRQAQARQDGARDGDAVRRRQRVRRSNVVDHVYKTPELASQGAGDLVAEAAGEPPRMFGPDEAPAHDGLGARLDGARRQAVSGAATTCPSCNKPLPAAVVNGPAQAVVRCEGCQTLLLWSNGRVMRSAKSSTGTMMGMPAVKLPTTPGDKEAEAPLPSSSPRRTRRRRQSERRRSRAGQGAAAARGDAAAGAGDAAEAVGVTGLTDNVPTKVAAPPPELRKEAARRDPTPVPPARKDRRCRRWCGGSRRTRRRRRRGRI